MAQSATASLAKPASELAEERKRNLILLVGLAVAIIYPFLDQALGINRLGSWIAIFVFVILAMGLNVVVGYAGLLDLGYAAFFIIGAYANAFMTSPNSIFVVNGWVPPFLQSFWPAMAVSCWGPRRCACAVTTWRLSPLDSAKLCPTSSSTPITSPADRAA